ncbi:hypothetical protein [Anaerosporobacter sp.]|uniref:hypothetical protein n=1 Tax=Anaerosporobacter sp. TaxID=1872529 RepID=UPI0028A24041|nr:hypothetical protein [Anaerosporobacter sp.]
MSFKDTVKEDIQNIFFNTDEFASEHILDGKEVVIVVYNEKLSSISATKSNDYDGIFNTGLFNSEIVFYINEEYIENEFFVGQLVNLDNNDYRVDKSTKVGSVYTVALGAFDS